MLFQDYVIPITYIHNAPGLFKALIVSTICIDRLMYPGFDIK